MDVALAHARSEVSKPMEGLGNCQRSGVPCARARWQLRSRDFSACTNVPFSLSEFERLDDGHGSRATRRWNGAASFSRRACYHAPGAATSDKASRAAIAIDRPVSGPTIGPAGACVAGEISPFFTVFGRFFTGAMLSFLSGQLGGRTGIHDAILDRRGHRRREVRANRGPVTPSIGAAPAEGQKRVVFCRFGGALGSV